MKEQSTLLNSISAGVVTGILEVTVIISLSSLIYSGDLNQFVGRGIGLAIVGAFVLITLIGLSSRSPGMMSGVQDVPSVVLAIVALHISERAFDQNMGDDKVFMTVAVALGLAALMTGLCFILIGTLKLASIIRFLPYPVTGGLLAGTGWLLFDGGLGVTTGGASYSDFLESNLLVKWLPAVLFAVVLLVALRRFDHYLIVPGFLVGTVILFFVGLAISGTSIDTAGDNGLLMAELEGELRYSPILPSDLGDVEWSLILDELPSLLSVVALSTVMMVLNLSGLEIVLQQDLPINEDLGKAGAVNALVGMMGGLIGFHTVSMTAFGKRIGARNRLFPVVAALICVVALLFGTNVLTYFPKPIIGGILAFLGLSFMVDWLIDERLPRADYGIVLIILLSIAFIGFLEGVIIGILVAMLRFVYDYSRLDSIRNEFTGREFNSTIQRSPDEQAYLNEYGHQIRIIQLQGFVFFGTASALYTHIRAKSERLRYLIVDFRHVVQMDVSAAYTMTKLELFCQNTKVKLAFSAIPTALLPQFEVSSIKQFDDLDYALADAEAFILANRKGVSPRDTNIHTHLMAVLPDYATILTNYFEREEISQGTVIEKQGAVADTLLFVESGMLSVNLEIARGPDMRVSTIKPGALVGEIALYRGIPRTASIIADVDSVIYRLSAESLERMEQNHPETASSFHRYIARLLAERLADTTKVLERMLNR